MKKIFTFLSIVAIMLFIVPVSAKITIMEDLATKFNASKTIDTYEALLDKVMSAKLENGNLVISVGDNDITYTLDGNVISSNVSDNYAYVIYLVLDSLGQLQGYNDGDVIKNVNMFYEEYEKYTLDNEGFELTHNESTSTYTVKMDVTKKIPLIDESEFYLKPEEFDFVAEIIEDEDVGNQTGISGKLAYNIIVNEDYNYIYIGETGSLSESSYKSILSALEVMYNEDTVADYISKYPSLDEGSYMLDGYDIEVDYYMDIEEQPMFEGRQVVLVKVDNAYVKDMFMRTEYIGENVNGGDKVVTLDFSNGKTYELGFFDSISNSGDVGFIYKYILEPATANLSDDFNSNVIYFNVLDGKIVLGDEENSVFKVTVDTDNYTLTIASTKDAQKEKISLNYPGLTTKQYQECEYYHEHFRYVLYDTTVNIIFGEVYDVIKGDGNTVNPIKGETLSFEFDVDFDDFNENGKVYFDGTLVDSSSYIATKGSTIITFNSNFAKNITAGTHTVKLTTANGYALATVNIKTATNPNTGDNIITYIGLLGISVCALLGCKKYLKD